MKPWRQIAKPHRDVLEGTLKQSEFAADIFHVMQGDASPEYLDAEKFYARTYITEGMRLLLISVAQRLTGKAGDPVIQLQTNFGGGKTHTLLAVYHLATRKCSTEELPADYARAYAKANTKMSFDAAKDILEHRGEQPRLHRNRLIFLAPDLNIVTRVQDQCRTFLAWSEIVGDIESGRLNLDTFQAKQAKKEKDVAQQILKKELLECYRFVLVPRQSGPRDVTFDVTRIGTANGGNMASTIEKQLTEDQSVILKWSPVHLKTGMSPKIYIDRLKMMQACDMLTNSGTSIKTIASTFGYVDPYHFSRRFKAVLGISPQCYRTQSKLL